MALFIDAIDFVRFDGELSTPTAILFTSTDDFLTGQAAVRAESPELVANRGFKLALGATGSSTRVENRLRYPTAKGGDKTAVNITREYCLSLLEHAQHWIQQQGLATAGNIIVSEPLKFYVSDQRDDWLQNYRYFIRRILLDRFAHVDFLPEPFAVFQYYRIGKNHPSVQGKRKYVAMVLDFGGGTFDSSVIETTKDGDISQSGSNSKPFAASSDPIGGDFIDEIIATHCMPMVFDNDIDRKALRQVFKRIPKWNSSIIADLNAANAAVYQWLQYTKHRAEVAKISLCRAMRDWNLDAIPKQTVNVEVPRNPFDPQSDLVSVELTSQEFFDLFEQEVWNKRLRGTIKSALRRAADALEGRSVNLLLLSGGSCNIGWVGKLIDRDFENELREATRLSLTSDFQTIVAQGLAVECARRYLLDDGPGRGTPSPNSSPIFTSSRTDADTIGSKESETPGVTDDLDCVRQRVTDQRAERHHEAGPHSGVIAPTDTGLVGLTYNALALALSASDGDPEFVQLKPFGATKDLVSRQRRGVMVEAGTPLSQLIDHTLEWQVKLPKAPTHRLRYLFTRGTQGNNETIDAYNVQERYVNTAGFKAFHSHIWVAIDVMADGTCKPYFIYARDRSGAPLEVRRCMPFALDSSDLWPSIGEAPIDGNQRTGSIYASTTDATSPAVRCATKDRPQSETISTSQPSESAFFGFDFGSTNSAVSYVSERSIQITDTRGTDYQWGSLRESIEELPQSVAYAAAMYLSPREPHDQSLKALALFEASYSFLAYLAYSESRTIGHKQTHLLKQLRHRSAGPLVDLLRSSLSKAGSRGLISKEIVTLKSRLVDGCASIVDELNELKHGKLDALSGNADRFCRESALCVARVLEGRYFGCFTNVEKDPFDSASTAALSLLCGTSSVVDRIRCSSKSSLPTAVPYVIDAKTGTAVCLAPLMMCGLGDRPLEIWLYDGPKGDGSWSYKAASRSEQVTISPEANRGLSKLLAALREVDGAHAADLQDGVVFEREAE